MTEVTKLESGITMNVRNHTATILELSKKQYKFIKNRKWSSSTEVFTLMMIKKLKEYCGNDVDKCIVLQVGPESLARVNFDKGTSLYTIEVLEGDLRESAEFFDDTPVSNGYDRNLCMYLTDEWKKNNIRTKSVSVEELKEFLVNKLVEECTLCKVDEKSFYINEDEAKYLTDNFSAYELKALDLCMESMDGVLYENIILFKSDGVGGQEGSCGEIEKKEDNLIYFKGTDKLVC